MRPPSVVRSQVVLLLATAIACGGATPEPEVVLPAPDPWVELAPPGSRLRVHAPAAERVRHSLRYHAGALELRFADATVEPGGEREVAEAYLTHLASQAGGAEITHRPFALDGAEGVDVTMASAPVVRAILLWRDGAVGRLEVRHAPEDAGAAARVIDSLAFDASAALDPRAALALDADPVEDLPLLRVSTEQLVFREGGVPSPFAAERAALDVAWADHEGRTPTELEQGRLLGTRFHGLPLEDTRLARFEGEGLPGFALRSVARIEGRELALLGAYLEVDGGALLVRASVPRAREAEWSPRFWALVRSLRVR